MPGCRHSRDRATPGEQPHSEARLGWNFGLIGGTALIVDATTPITRAETQGSVDVLIALASAAGGAMSGMVVASSCYAALDLGGGVLAVLLIPARVSTNRKYRNS